jgi:hypothetical protein
MYNDIAAAENLEQRSSPAAGLLTSFDELCRLVMIENIAVMANGASKLQKWMP